VIRPIFGTFARFYEGLVGAADAIHYQAELSPLDKLQENLQNVRLVQIASRHAQDCGRLTVTGA
jgi:hypothetical protein